ncbi:hypothetical protein P7D22_21780 [Lichenihabitans sp. Uapishka_5]|uniref:hypothetical protein n=1 Tax=Lichenihabitans sp. Uapishka_5 TaxID=3037302 RepID=UPI0029E80E72|nr:hypothetical protein [Lichenihabitans sp. Uapishka_5]MDX7953798.1 hypothetical protein [Lichenihabitans sp. Uapishka_5]
MFALLCADAAEDGIGEDDLRDLLVDPFEAMIRVMMEVSPSQPGFEATGDAGPGQGHVPPATAMRLAISYLDGFRDVVRGDIDLAADLVLFNLAQQGFQLTAWTDLAASPQRSSPGYRNLGMAVPTPRDLLDDPLF